MIVRNEPAGSVRRYLGPILILFSISNVLIMGSALSESYAMGTVTPPPEETYPEGTIFKPDWEIGDQWSMGYTETLSDKADELISSMEYMGIDIKDVNLDGEVGFYQSAKVTDDDAVITVGNNEYVCYEVYFEQYSGFACNMEYVMAMSVPDYDYYEYEEYEEYEYTEYSTRASPTELSSTQEIEMKCSAYYRVKGDITGNMYYNVADLAVVKGSYDMIMDSDINMDMYAKMDGEEPMTMSMKMKMNIENFNAIFDVEYDPPLDIFNFPIEPDESWVASSKMKKILNDISGTISYEMTMKVTGISSDSVDETIILAEEITTPDSYGPITVTYHLYNSGTDTVILANGMSTECFVIEPYDYYSGYDYDYDSYMNMDEYAPSAISPFSAFSGSEPDAYDFDAESMEDPVETIMDSKNYYSEDEENIVSYTAPADESSMSSVPMTVTGEETSIEPASYDDVTDFKTVAREDMLSRYPKDIADEGSGGGEEWSTWTIIIIIITAVFIVFLISVLALRASKKKKQRQFSQEPQPLSPTQPTQYSSTSVQCYPYASAGSQGNYYDNRPYLDQATTQPHLQHAQQHTQQPPPSTQPNYYQDGQYRAPDPYHSQNQYQNQYQNQSQPYNDYDAYYGQHDHGSHDYQKTPQNRNYYDERDDSRYNY